MSSISLFDIISVVFPDPNIFYVFLHLLLILLQLILKELILFPPDCIILDNWAFDNLISVDDLSTKVLRRFETCLLVNNNLWGKLISSSPTMFDDNLRNTSVLVFYADFNLLSCEFDSFSFKLLYCVILYW